MYRFAFWPIALAIALLQPHCVQAQNVRYYEQDGRTYKETVRTIRRPVVQTEWQQRERTVYRQQLRTELRDTLRTYATPVTQHEWVTRMHGRWNPFMTPYFTHHLVPVTRWERRAEVVQVPSVATEWVPEKRTVSVPVTTQRMAEEKVVTRVPVDPPSASPSHQIVQRPQSVGTHIGGTAMESDPPRHGLQWRPPGGTVVR